MATSKKPRKKYNPHKLATATPVTIRYNNKDALKLQLAPQISLGEFKSGKGHAANWHTIWWRIHFGKQLAHLFDGGEHETYLDQALAIMDDVKDRAQEEPYFWTIEPSDANVVGQVLTLVDEMQESTTRRDQLTASLAVAKIDEELNTSLVS